MLILQGASVFPVPESFNFWKRANRTVNVNKTSLFCSFFIKKCFLQKPTKPKGLQAWNCALLPSFMMLF